MLKSEERVHVCSFHNADAPVKDEGVNLETWKVFIRRFASSRGWPSAGQNHDRKSDSCMSDYGYRATLCD